MAESLPGLLCLGIILALAFIAWKNHSAKEKEREERFQYQQAIFET